MAMYTTGAASEIFRLTIQYNDSAGTEQYVNIAEAVTTAGQWVQLADTNFQIPAGARDVILYIETAEESTINFYVDELIGAAAGTKITPSNHNIFISAINIVGKWIEIKNVSDNTVSTKGLYLTNDSEDYFMWQLPSILLAGNATIRLQTHDSTATDGIKRMVTNFTLTDGERIWLVDINGNLLSSLVVTNTT